MSTASSKTMPFTRLIPLLLVPAAAFPSSSNDPPRHGRVISVSQGSANQIFEITTHPNIPTIIEFPEPWLGTPVCGDCIALAAPADVLAQSEALFGYQVFQDSLTIVIKAAQFSAEEGGTVPVRRYLTSLNVRLVSKLTLTLIVRYGPLEKADARVSFTLPERINENAYIEEQVARREAALEQQYAARVESGVTQALLRAFAEPHECVQLKDRRWHDQVHLELRELCRFGSRIFLIFTVENRGRVPLQFGEVRISRISGTSSMLVTGSQLYPKSQQVPFQGMLTAVVGFGLGSQEETKVKYELYFRENGGKGREVTLRGFGF